MVELENDKAAYLQAVHATAGHVHSTQRSMHLYRYICNLCVEKYIRGAKSNDAIG